VSEAPTDPEFTSHTVLLSIAKVCETIEVTADIAEGLSRDKMWHSVSVSGLGEDWPAPYLSYLMAPLIAQNLAPISHSGHWSVPLKVSCGQCEERFIVSTVSVRNGTANCRICRYLKMWKSGSRQEVSDWLARNFRFSLDLEESEEPSQLLGQCTTCNSRQSFSLRDVARGTHLPCGTCSQRPWGVVYLIVEPTLEILKVGRSTSWGYAQRLQDHSRTGWREVLHRSVPNQVAAEEVEMKVLDLVRVKLSLPVSASDESMPQGGYSETFPIKSRQGKDIQSQVVSFIDGLTTTHSA